MRRSRISLLATGAVIAAAALNPVAAYAAPAVAAPAAAEDGEAPAQVCEAVDESTFSVTNLTDTSATVSWEAKPLLDMYLVFLNQEYIGEPLRTPTYDFTGLTQGTVYTVEVLTFCTNTTVPAPDWSLAQSYPKVTLTAGSQPDAPLPPTGDGSQKQPAPQPAPGVTHSPEAAAVPASTPTVLADTGVELWWAGGGAVAIAAGLLAMIAARRLSDRRAGMIRIPHDDRVDQAV